MERDDRDERVADSLGTASNHQCCLQVNNSMIFMKIMVPLSDEKETRDPLGFYIECEQVSQSLYIFSLILYRPQNMTVGEGVLFLWWGQNFK